MDKKICPPKYVAKRMKHTPAWVNGDLYKCKHKLTKMVKAWWNERLEDNPEVTLPQLFDDYIKRHCKNIKVD
jgi:hypothetical protein